MNLTNCDLPEWLFEPISGPKPLPPGYVWKVIYDPTRSEEEPGLFSGAYFRFLDIVHGKKEECTWPEGIVFEHKDTGDLLTIRQGQIHYPEKQSTLKATEHYQGVQPQKRGVILITIIGNDSNKLGEGV